jgi:hypothetical protein
MEASSLSQSFLLLGAACLFVEGIRARKRKRLLTPKAAQTTALYLEAHELGMTSLQATLP